MTRDEEALAEAQLSGQATAKIQAEIARMRATDIHAHWRDWAVQYGTELRATTLSSSIKQLEIAALRRAIEHLVVPSTIANILEVGCGNGQNVVALAKIFEEQAYTWHGIDYVPEMVEAARKNAEAAQIRHSTRFTVGDVLDLGASGGLDPHYAIVMTDRLLINLETIEKQKAGIDQLAERVAKHGALVLIENSRQTKDAQNRLRLAMDLSPRKDADFNLFFDDTIIVPFLESRFSSVEIEDFGSLHDIILYALLPHAMGAEFQYDHPIMTAVAKLCTHVQIPAGCYGQNRLYLCRNPR
jgi:ubiquinone/menaquinone biosynthesis C-methylase UbiE